jgi:hypothetical protein
MLLSDLEREKNEKKAGEAEKAGAGVVVGVVFVLAADLHWLVKPK